MLRLLRLVILVMVCNQRHGLFWHPCAKRAQPRSTASAAHATALELRKKLACCGLADAHRRQLIDGERSEVGERHLALHEQRNHLLGVAHALDPAHPRPQRVPAERLSCLPCSYFARFRPLPSLVQGAPFFRDVVPSSMPPLPSGNVRSSVRIQAPRTSPDLGIARVRPTAPV